jgi:hypothetical protein
MRRKSFNSMKFHKCTKEKWSMEMIKRVPTMTDKTQAHLRGTMMVTSRKVKMRNDPLHNLYINNLL